jgi:hypothetical protein
MDISVRACSEQEALDYIQDRSVVKFLSLYPDSVKDDFAMLVMDEKLLVLAKAKKNKVEIHVACKYRDRATVRQTMQQGLEWFGARGFTTVWTTAPDDRSSLIKMLQSLNFRKAKQRWIWESKQQ